MGFAYRLTFLLPRILVLSAMPGRHQPCLAGCLLEVGRAGHVVVQGQSRELVFDQARRFLRIVARGHGALSIAAVLQGPLGRDGWSIIIGADVAFTATTLPPDLPRASPNGGGEVVAFPKAS